MGPIRTLDKGWIRAGHSVNWAEQEPVFLRREGHKGPWRDKHAKHVAGIDECSTRLTLWLRSLYWTRLFRRLFRTSLALLEVFRSSELLSRYL